MNLPRRSFYYKPKKKPSDKALIERIEQICLDFPKYGYRRVTEQIELRLNNCPFILNMIFKN
jgi:hypothetical protein